MDIDDKPTSGTRLGGDHLPPVGPELAGDARSTPGDAALARSDKEQIDRYVEWQHDPERENYHRPA